MTWSLTSGFYHSLKRATTVIPFVVLFFIPTSYATEVNRVSISLSDVVRQTLANNPQLTQFTYKEKVLDGEAKTASLTPAYTLGVELENILGTGTVSAFSDAELTVSLSSVIELGDKLEARTAFVNAKRQQINVEKRIQTLDILGEATRRYISVLSQQQLLAVASNAETLARYAFQAVSKRVKAGASPQIEMKRAEAALAQARLEVELEMKKLNASKQSLTMLWGEQYPQFERVTGDLFSFNETISYESLVSQLTASPHLLAFAEESRVQQAQLRMSQSAAQYDISWTAGIRRLQGIDETTFVAGVSVPLFNKDRNMGDYEAQKARLDELEQRRLTSLRELYHQLNQAMNARERALLEVQTLSQNIIPPLEDALSLAEEAYRNGRFTYLEWVTTRQELLGKQRSLINAASQVHMRNADIEALTGLSLFPEAAVRKQSPATDVTHFNEN